eukprot:bmy_10862T0
MNDPRPWITTPSSRKVHRSGVIPRRVPAKVSFQACPTQAPAPSPPRGTLEHPNPTAGSGDASGGSPEADPNGHPPPPTPGWDPRARRSGEGPGLSAAGEERIASATLPAERERKRPASPATPQAPQPWEPQRQTAAVASNSHKPRLQRFRHGVRQPNGSGGNFQKEQDQWARPARPRLADQVTNHCRRGLPFPPIIELTMGGAFRGTSNPEMRGRQGSPYCPMREKQR